MQILGPFNLLIVICAVLSLLMWPCFGQMWMDCASLFEFLTQNVDFGGGFLGFGCFFSRAFISLILGLCSMLLLFFYDFLEKHVDLKNGICSKIDSDEVCDTKIKFLGSSESVEQDRLGGGDSDEEKECCGEDEVFDVMTLREMVKKERERANSACGELEKERMAASSAAREAMAMILRLQSEE
ncbi:hypothetical protein HS088_TW18G00586 [Tripterygium wilfordii]|uniref:GTD-binding domain-containing protein n=1 Tax=Tripterygium wilfordii TaxID=458696 RepID=A0A7J7CCT4_TRIWF|nr:hypothetical protein HS088_TW18G00586 [Tripterygium wilfordii]